MLPSSICAPCACANLPTIINLNITLTDGSCTDCDTAGSGTFALTQANNCVWQSDEFFPCASGSFRWFLSNPSGVWTLWLVDSDFGVIHMEFTLDNSCDPTGTLTLTSSDGVCNGTTADIAP